MPDVIRLLIAASAVLAAVPATHSIAAEVGFGPSNPFYAASTLPFLAPPFDRIRDEHYQPAIEAGMMQQQAEIRTIAENPAKPTFENTLVPFEKSGLLLERARAAFNAVSQANTNPTLQAVKAALAPKLAAHYDAIYFNPKLFARVASVYKQRESHHFHPELRRRIGATPALRALRSRGLPSCAPKEPPCLDFRTTPHGS